jgi:hypothetical protein
MQQCQGNFHLIFAPGFDPNEWCLKNGLLSGGLNPRPLSLESSALTTRPQLLANDPHYFHILRGVSFILLFDPRSSSGTYGVK